MLETQLARYCTGFYYLSIFAVVNISTSLNWNWKISFSCSVNDFKLFKKKLCLRRYWGGDFPTSRSENTLELCCNFNRCWLIIRENAKWESKTKQFKHVTRFHYLVHNYVVTFDDLKFNLKLARLDNIGVIKNLDVCCRC